MRWQELEWLRAMRFRHGVQVPERLLFAVFVDVCVDSNDSLFSPLSRSIASARKTAIGMLGNLLSVYSDSLLWFDLLLY